MSRDLDPLGMEFDPTPTPLDRIGLFNKEYRGYGIRIVERNGDAKDIGADTIVPHVMGIEFDLSILECHEIDDGLWESPGVVFSIGNNGYWVASVVSSGGTGDGAMLRLYSPVLLTDSLNVDLGDGSELTFKEKSSFDNVLMVKAWKRPDWVDSGDAPNKIVLDIYSSSGDVYPEYVLSGQEISSVWGDPLVQALDAIDYAVECMVSG